jgi:hypothetical protein
VTAHRLFIYESEFVVRKIFLRVLLVPLVAVSTGASSLAALPASVSNGLQGEERSQPTAPPFVAAANRKVSYRTYRAPGCGEWTQVRKGLGASFLLEAAYNIWFHGYVSGFNVHGPDPSGSLLEKTDWQQAASFFDSYCARNPSHLLADGLQPLVVELMKDRPVLTGKQSKPRAQVTVGTTCKEWNSSKDDRLLRVTSGGAARGYLTAYNRWVRMPRGTSSARVMIPLSTSGSTNGAAHVLLLLCFRAWVRS